VVVVGLQLPNPSRWSLSGCRRYCGGTGAPKSDDNQRKIAKEAARLRTKAGIAAVIAEVTAMKQHLIKAKNGAIAVAQDGWKQNPAYIRQFHAEIPEIFKYYYKDSVVIPVRTAAMIFDVVKQLTEINALVETAALETDAAQRQRYNIGNQLAALYDRVIGNLDDLDRELEDEYNLYIS
jgi:hypothetical protein